MSRGLTVLELRQAQPDFALTGLPQRLMDMRLQQGECTLLTTHAQITATAFSNLCCGIQHPSSGAVLFQGLDWTQINTLEQYALRGRIGRTYQRGAWNTLSGTDHNILLPRLHHTRQKLSDLVDEAVKLCLEFGLPGLPTVPPAHLSETDLARASYVRAFMGQPALLLLDPPPAPEIMPTLLSALTRALDRGAAAICFNTGRNNWRPFADAFSHRFLLNDNGLIPLRVS
ncbi:ABC transporter ATP-binding protein [Granulibacter bethesdensis]|uniref:ATP-binding cassette domain-containing protein n=1 Tax=Granulibacter bethesdensis TaxID=364410 RepID=UPI00090A8ABD|nr:ATP-binding cassette domain-containing protein [Granulibacter bethesdensis]APH57253.1 ABC transporter ATP-binding protein [Granulibacter bethesdensis]